MGRWVWVPCPFLCVYMWGEGVNIRLRAWGWEHMLVFMCACRLRLCVRSGLRLRLTHHLVDPHPTTMPCRWRMPPVRWWFLAPGQDARASAAHSRRSIGGAWPYWPCWAPIVGWGAFGLRAQGRSALVWSAAGGGLRDCRHGTLGRLHCGCGGPAFGLSSALFWVEAAVCPCGGSPGGPVPWGASGCLGPGSFPCLLHALRDGLLFPTHTIKHLHGGNLMNTKRAHTHRCTLKHSHWCKNRCSQTPIVLICCCFKTYFVILVSVLLNNINI